MSFDRSLFARKIRVKMAEEGITGSDTGRILGVCGGTVCRISKKGGTKSPNVETFLKACKWLGMSPFDFIKENHNEQAAI